MNNTFDTYTFPSSDGTSTCSGIVVLPDDEPRALMILSHGMAEHMQRYLPFMQIMAEHGILCFGHDHIGHGTTAASPADLGYLPKKTGAAVLVADVICDAKRFHECYPALPLILFGHSMGSFIARLAAADDHAQLFDALILSGTGGSNPLSGIAMTLLSVLCALRGERSYSGMMNAMMFDPYSERFEKRTAFDWLTTDHAAVDRYIADPLCGFPFTVSALYVLISLLRGANQSKTYRDTPDTLPITLISGRDDPVGNYGNGVHAVADAYRAGECSRVSHTLYTGARHELLNEPIAAQVTAELIQWLTPIITNHPKRSSSI